MKHTPLPIRSLLIALAALLLVAVSAFGCDPANPPAPSETAESTLEDSIPEDISSADPTETAEPPTESTDETGDVTDEESTVTTSGTDTVETPTETTAGSATTTKPAETTQKPAETTKKPAETTQKPAETTKKPTETTAKPAETTKKPTETTQKPAETTQKPAETTQKPAETTQKPAETTAKPAETTQRPVETTAPPVTKEPEPCDHISSTGSLKVTMTEAHKIEPLTDSNGVLCYVVQGGCSDGTYYYVGLNNGVKTTDSITAVRKYEIATGKLVATYENLRVSHCNDMEYLPHTGEIVFVHNTPDRWHISFYDAETMQPSVQTRWGDGTSHTITLYYKGADGGRGEQMEIYSLTFDRFESCYWVGISNGYKFAKLDLNFNHTGDIYQGKETGYTKQGMTCDSKYIYFQQYKTNAILVYDKAGNFVREIPLTKTSNEPENIYYVGDVFYVAYLINKQGSMLYKVELEQVSSHDVAITVGDTFTTIPQFTADDGTIYKVAQGSCTDGTYLYVLLNDDNKSGSSGHQSTLFKIDLRTGAVVQRVENINAGSSNDMTYNPNTRELLIATDNPNKTRIVVLDATTLTVKKDLTIATKTFAIAFDEAQNSYWLTCAGTYDFVRADTDLKQIGDTYAGYNTGYTKQAMDYDGEYLYFLQSGTNAVSIFRKDGVFIGVATFPTLTYTLPNGTTATASSVQSICHVGDTFYIGCYFSGYGCVIFECEINISGG